MLPYSSSSYNEICKLITWPITDDDKTEDYTVSTAATSQEVI